MKNILLRLFIIAPLKILWFLSMLTIVIPIIYWVFTGNYWIDINDDIDEI